MINSIIRKDTALSDALEAFDSGQPKKASDLCTRRMELAGESAAALLLRSMCYVSMGQSQSAIDDNGRALNMLSLSGSELLAFADESAEYGLEPGYCATVMENAGRDLEGQAELSAQMLFSAANAYNRAGICRYRAGSPLELESADFERGRALLLQARKSIPADRDEQLLLALVSSNLAECCFRGGDNVRSRRLFEESSIAIEPYVKDDPTYLHQYSFCQSCLFDIDRAEDNNVEAMRRMTGLIHIYESVKGRLSEDQRIALAACYIRRGSVRFQMGNYSGDVSDCTRAVSLVSGTDNDEIQLAQIYFARAEAYEQLEQLDKAADDYDGSASLLEQHDDKISFSQTIGLRRFLEACCHERLGDPAAAARSYRCAAEAFSMFGDISRDVSAPPPQPDREMAALCRFRCGRCLCRTETKDYRESFAQLLKAYDILDDLADEPLTAGKKSVIANAVGELYELFDDYDRAADYFSLAEDLLGDIDESSKKRILAVTGRMLDPAGNGTGAVRHTPSFRRHGSAISDNMFSDSYYYDEDAGGDTDEDPSGELDEEIDAFFDALTDEYDYYDDYDDDEDYADEDGFSVFAQETVRQSDGAVYGRTISDEAMHDSAIHDETMHDSAIHDEAMHDSAIHDEAMHDGAMHDGAMHDGAMSDRSINTSASDQSGDKGEEPAQQQEDADGGSEIWTDASDNTPKG